MKKISTVGMETLAEIYGNPTEERHFLQNQLKNYIEDPKEEILYELIIDKNSISSKSISITEIPKISNAKIVKLIESQGLAGSKTRGKISISISTLIKLSPNNKELPMDTDTNLPYLKYSFFDLFIGNGYMDTPPEVFYPAQKYQIIFKSGKDEVEIDENSNSNIMNIEIPSAVLENPSIKDEKDEIIKIPAINSNNLLGFPPDLVESHPIVLEVGIATQNKMEFHFYDITNVMSCRNQILEDFEVDLHL